MKSWRDNIRKVTPYTPGEQPKVADVIKLNTNENPYPPSPMVKVALDSLDTDVLRKYPEPDCSKLIKAIAKCYGVEEDKIFVGVGSDDVLAMAFLTFFNSEKPILFPDITYSFYDVWAELFHIPYSQPKLDEHFNIRKKDYMVDNGGIVIANPNAPTGVELSSSDIEDIISANRNSVVIIDEAYVDFGAHSMLNLIDKYDNLLVVRTTSKSRSLAGMRIGYAFGSKDMIKALNDVKYSFNSYTMNYTSLVLGAAAFNDKQYFEKTCRKIVNTREETKEKLRNLGFEFEDSKTNFIFATHKKLDISSLFKELRDHQIYVRHFEKPIIDQYLRITIGTPEEMDTLINYLKGIICNT